MNVQNLWGPEAQFSAWLSSSFLLMTVSLLFYHMTKTKSFEMTETQASFFSIALILIAATITLLALYTYYNRITELLTNQKNVLTPAEKNERHYKYVYMVIGLVIVFIELYLCIVIIKGSKGSFHKINKINNIIVKKIKMMKKKV
jgi:ABC-type transport system involved in cytochrome bd biosynthesis fused ATPase/permease subunit